MPYTKTIQYLVQSAAMVAVLTSCTTSTAHRKGDTMPANTSQKAALVDAETWKLDNGLEVIFVEDHNTPVVAVQMWVRTGSADEIEGEFGLAHVHEHMLFKGTDKRGVGVISQDVEGSGGSINAFTSYDMTVYYLTMSSENWRTGMDVIADAIQHSTFDQAELDKELEVVLEEVRRGEDNPGRVLSQNMFDLVFQEHTYKRPVIGYSESIEAFTREGILDFYRKWYTPNNMTLVVVGDIPAAEFRAETEALYGSAEAREIARPDHGTEPVQGGSRARVIRFDTERPRVAIGARSVASDHADAIALDILSEMLSEGMNSVLFQEMKFKQDLAIQVGSYNYTPADPGIFEFEASFEPAKLENGLQRLLTLVRSAHTWQFDPALLEAAKSRIKGEFSKAMETTSGKAHQVGSFAFYHGDPAYANTYLRTVDRLTTADLQRVAEAYLAEAPLNIVLMLPESSQSNLTEKDLLAYLAATKPEAGTQVGSSEGLRAPVADGPPLQVVSHSRENGIDDIRFDNGLRLLVKEDNKAPLFTINTHFPGGLRAEQAGQEGWFQQLAMVWPHGTGSLGPQEIDQLHSLIGGDTHGFADRDTFGLSGSYLSEHLEEAVQLYGALLAHPTLPEQLSSIQKNRMLQRLATLQDNLFRYGLKHFLADWYGDHPYGHLSEGTEQSLGALQQQDLVALHSTFARPENATIAVVGDVKADAVIQYLAQALSGWSGAQPAMTIPKPNSPQKHESVVPTQKEQTHIWWGFPGLDRQHADRYIVDVIDTIFSGMGGRLFMRLRDELSLAYSVTSFHIAPTDPGFFVLYIAGDPEKESIALTEFQKQIAGITDTAVPSDELARAKRYLLGSRDISRERFSSEASLILSSARYHNNPGFYLQYHDRIAGIDAGDVQRVAREIFAKDRSLRMILRSQAK